MAEPIDTLRAVAAKCDSQFLEVVRLMDGDAYGLVFRHKRWGRCRPESIMVSPELLADVSVLRTFVAQRLRDMTAKAEAAVG